MRAADAALGGSAQKATRPLQHHVHGNVHDLMAHVHLQLFNGVPRLDLGEQSFQPFTSQIAGQDQLSRFLTKNELTERPEGRQDVNPGKLAQGCVSAQGCQRIGHLV